MAGNSDRIFGIGFVAMGLALFAYSLSFHETDLMGDLGPGFLSGLVGVILAVLELRNTYYGKTGAGSGNRTRVFSLEGCCSTIELYPPVPDRQCSA